MTPGHVLNSLGFLFVSLFLMFPFQFSVNPFTEVLFFHLNFSTQYTFQSEPLRSLSSSQLQRLFSVQVSLPLYLTRYVFIYQPSCYLKDLRDVNLKVCEDHTGHECFLCVYFLFCLLALLLAFNMLNSILVCSSAAPK